MNNQYFFIAVAIVILYCISLWSKYLDNNKNKKEMAQLSDVVTSISELKTELVNVGNHLAQVEAELVQVKNDLLTANQKLASSISAEDADKFVADINAAVGGLHSLIPAQVAAAGE